MLGFASLVSSRRAAWIIIPLFVIAAFALGSLQPKLQEKSETASVSSWLPRGSDSRAAFEALDERLDRGDSVGGLLVFAAEDGERLSEQQQEAIGDFVRAVEQAAAEEEEGLERLESILNPYRPEGATPGSPVPAAPAGRLVSDDGAVATAPFTIRAQNEPQMRPVVEELRERMDDLPATLDVHLTGEAGLNIDAIDVIGSIDGALLTATVVLVLVLLLAIYRSPLIAVVPVIAVGLSYMVAAGLAYLLTESTGIDVNAQTTGILIVLMFGAGTDYCLLLVSRYRDELHRHEHAREAMREALTHTTLPILTSGATVVAAMLVLLFARYAPNHDMGPVLALGIGCTMLAGLLLLPAVLATLGRRAFWPAVPAFDHAAAPKRRVWNGIASFVDRRPWPALIIPVIVLAVFAVGNRTDMPTVGWGSADAFRASTDSGDGLELLQRAFPAGTLAPNSVIVSAGTSGDARAAAADVARELQTRDEISAVAPVTESEDGTDQLLSLFMTADPYSDEAADAVPSLRRAIEAAAAEHDAHVLLGGPSAQNYDTQQATDRDNRVVIPLVLVTIFVILVALLRALVAPAHIMASVVLSFAATLGLSTWLFANAFDQPGMASGMALFVFIFVVALGVDYNIFLVSRIREETAARASTRYGVIAGLAATGGVITSAGIILAGTFSVLAVLPLLMLFQMGFAVALGVLLDTFVVRSLLVPATMRLLGDVNWWPGRSHAAAAGSDDAGAPPADGGAAERAEVRPPTPV